MTNKILIAKPTYNPLIETDPDKFNIHSDYPTLKYFAEGSIRINGSWTTNGTNHLYYLTDGSDDAYTNDASINTSGFYSFGNSGGVIRHAGLKFRNITIPRNSTILNAWIYFIADTTRTEDNCNARIYGEASSNPNSFSSYADFIGRTLTSNYVDWNNVEHWTNGFQYESPNIKTIIQEIINRSDWDSGDNLAIFIKNNGSSTNARRASFGYEDGYQTMIVIEYIAPGEEVKTFTTQLAHGLGYVPQFDVSVDFGSGGGEYNLIPYIFSVITIGSEIASVWADDTYLYFEVQLRPGLTSNLWNYDFTFYYKLYKNRLGL